MYLMELLAIVASLHLAANINITTKEIVADSQGCYQTANIREKHPLLTDNYIALMSPLQHYLKGLKG